MPLEKLYQSLVWLQAPSPVSKLHLKNRMQTWSKLFYRHIKSDETPKKKSKKDSAKGSVAMLKELAQMNCVSQPPPKKSIRRKEGQRGTNSEIVFSRCTRHNLKIRERKGPSLGIIQKCVPHERSPCAPKFAERSQKDTLQRERCARKVAWNLAKFLYKLKKLDKATFHSPVEERRMPAPTSVLPEEKEFVVDSGGSMHMLSKKGFELR